jgi:radical SAM enzyme (TIGR01210 family)
MSAPSGGGSMRGVHNCGKCDEALLKAVEMYSMEGDASVLGKASCGCRAAWLDYLEVEPLAGTAGNLERLMPPQ